METARTWYEVSARAGRNDYPGLLANAVLVEKLLTDPAEIAHGIRSAWTSAEFPSRIMEATIWQFLFNEVLDEHQYLHEDEVRSSEELPATMTLWRGAIPSRRAGMSWTEDQDKARWFAERFNGGLSKTGYLYRLDVTPEMVLARFHEARGESEWVLDPDAVTEAKPKKDGAV